ncbi:hypothetical protein ELQ92_00230 [Labedella populi]|uniref:Uncharacterized protein n=1 Tax=Labedella populi TaxID=2498850 RepID=A0A3S3ZVT3_9MICO|nr:hypothetical protein [Labedella populi]RWZ67741.1 hypothetical protein ELQ92_00230 [Labedella populi]
MPPTAPDSFPLDSLDGTEPVRGRSWRSAVLGTVAGIFESIARTATRIAERARASSGASSTSSGFDIVGDVVTDEEIEGARDLFGRGSGPVDTDPSWPLHRPAA